MKRSVIIMLLILVAGTSVAHAHLFWRVNAGVSVPVQPKEFNTHYTVGGTAGLGFGYSANEYLGVYVSGDFTINGGTGGSKPINIITAFANVQINPMPEAKYALYFVAGGGYFRMWRTSNADNAPGALGGLGLSIEMNDKMDLMVEVDYLLGLTEGKATGVALGRIGISREL
jgi:hypothetical protein